MKGDHEVEIRKAKKKTPHIQYTYTDINELIYISVFRVLWEGLVFYLAYKLSLYARKNKDIVFIWYELMLSGHESFVNVRAKIDETERTYF